MKTNPKFKWRVRTDDLLLLGHTKNMHEARLLASKWNHVFEEDIPAFMLVNPKPYIAKFDLDQVSQKA